MQAVSHMPETKNVKYHQKMKENDENTYAAAFYEGLHVHESGNL